MNFHVVTLFPEMIEAASQIGIVGGAIRQGTVKLATVSPREFTSNVHHTVDDRPFGGGDGMIMMAEPLSQCLEKILSIDPAVRPHVIHVSPRGSVFTDQKARELARTKSSIVIVSSRYGGADQRFLNEFVDEEISIGDYVLSGGELAALVIIDAVARQLPGVLGNEASIEDESFAPGFGGLEHPQYTRPREWRGAEIPAALLSGHHGQIAEWKRALSVLVTLDKRPDLPLAASDLKLAQKVLKVMSDSEIKTCGLAGVEPLMSALRERIGSVKA